MATLIGVRVRLFLIYAQLRLCMIDANTWVLADRLKLNEAGWVGPCSGRNEVWTGGGAMALRFYFARLVT